MTGGAGRDSAVDTVVFDLGGVLIDWSPYHLYRKLLPDDAAIASFLAEVDLFGWLKHVDAQLGFERGVAALAARFPQHGHLIDAYWQRWAETLNGSMDDSVGLLAELRAAGTPLYAISNWATETWHHAEAFDFLDWFDGVVVSGHEGVAKPDAEIFERACARYGLSPARCVFIDDMPNNVEAARRLGFHAIAFTDAAKLDAELRALGFRF